MNHEVVSDEEILTDEFMDVDANDEAKQQVIDEEEEEEDAPPKIVRNIEDITEEEIRRINEEQWPYVNGTYDANGCWKDWNEITTGLSVDNNELIILPYTSQITDKQFRLDNCVMMELLHHNHTEEGDQCTTVLNHSNRTTHCCASKLFATEMHKKSAPHKFFIFSATLLLEILIAQCADVTLPRPIRADVFSPEDNYNVTVTNTCQSQFMRVEIKTTKPFYGVIHSRDQRRKPVCTVEGNGDTQYTLDINHVLSSQDPLYCGVARYKESREAKEQLNVVVVVRVHRNIELSDDRYFLLSCPNRCSRPDCARSPRSGDLTNEPNTRNTNNNRLINDPSNTNSTNIDDECTVWKFPWLITLCWCLAIISLSLLIVNCFLCSTLSCRFNKTEVEERAPSVYEDEDGTIYEPYKITYSSPTAAKLGAHQERLSQQPLVWVHVPAQVEEAVAAAARAPIAWEGVAGVAVVVDSEMAPVDDQMFPMGVAVEVVVATRPATFSGVHKMMSSVMIDWLINHDRRLCNQEIAYRKSAKNVKFRSRRVKFKLKLPDEIIPRLKHKSIVPISILSILSLVIQLMPSIGAVSVIENLNVSAFHHQEAHKLSIQSLVDLPMKSSSGSSDTGNHNNSSTIRSSSNAKRHIIEHTIEHTMSSDTGALAQLQRRIMPSFDQSLPVVVITSSWSPQVYLPCRVFNLGEQTVSWIRKSDATVLSVERSAFAGDDNDESRFQPVNNPADFSDWTLVLKSPQKSDSGIYECQVSWSRRPLERQIELRVVDAKSSIIESNGPSRLLYVRANEPLKLTCVIEAPSTPDFVYWYKNEHVVKLDMLTPTRRHVTDLVRHIATPLSGFTNSNNDDRQQHQQPPGLVVADARVLSYATRAPAIIGTSDSSSPSSVTTNNSNGSQVRILNRAQSASSAAIISDAAVARTMNVFVENSNAQNSDDRLGVLSPRRWPRQTISSDTWSNNQTHSLAVLTINTVQISDAGNYTCQHQCGKRMALSTGRQETRPSTSQALEPPVSLVILGIGLFAQQSDETEMANSREAVGAVVEPLDWVAPNDLANNDNKNVVDGSSSLVSL
ncbi:hypothetical protein GZH46_00610, partial [Fragariocoptes setiger]